MFSSQSRKMQRYLKFLIPHRSTCRGARWNLSTGSLQLCAALWPLRLFGHLAAT